MNDWIDIQCLISGETANIVAHKEYMPDAAKSTYFLTQGRNRLGSIAKGANGQYVAVNATELTQADIDNIGEKIDQYFNM
jgi:hypothetical protein